MSGAKRGKSRRNYVWPIGQTYLQTLTYRYPQRYDSYWISTKLRSLRMKSCWLRLLAVPVGAWQNKRVCTRLHFTRRLAL